MIRSNQLIAASCVFVMLFSLTTLSSARTEASDSYIIFQDDFSDATWTAENWDTQSGLWYVDAGQYWETSAYHNRVISLAGSTDSAVEAYDFTLSVKVTNNAFGTYGQGAIIPFRYLNYDHFGYVTFLENKIGLLFEIGYVYDCYGVVYYDVPIGYTQHELMITADGDNYQVFIDDMNAPVITETFSPAGFGDGTGVTGERLGVWTYEHGSASFDDFSVSVKSVDHWNVDIKPEILNINSAGNWITAYIEVPDEYDVNTIDVSTVRMSGIIPAETSMFGVGDYDRDKIPDMMVKFSRAKVCEQLVSGLNTLTITGCLHDGTLFSGDDIVVGIDQNARIALRS